MSMSTNVIGFRPPDEEWLKMKAVYDACEKAGVEIPDGVCSFFNYERPDRKGVKVDINDILEKYQDDSSSGYEIDLSKLPKGLKILRFYNSW